jgi:DNA-binding MarR family transcriptional regulator
VNASQFGGAADPIGETLDAAVDLTVRHLADRTGLSASASMVLNRVNREGAARITDLAAAEGISQPAMTQLIQRLARQGLVSRHGDAEDGRVALVALTESGQGLLAERTDERRGRLAELLATVSREDALTLWLCAQVALPILRQLLDNAAEPASPAVAEGE